MYRPRRRPKCIQHVLRDYAFIGDGYRGALIGRRGDVAWLCAPSWDSPAVLAQLIGGHGVHTVTPAERFVWGGSYEPGTLIWRSHWVTASTPIDCREAFALPADPHRLLLLRRIEAISSDAVIDIALDLRGDFGRAGRQECQRMTVGGRSARAT
jgi:alpha,alpha-trehalase